jgi:cell division protein FtsI (penicillin-binding protein 3)
VTGGKALRLRIASTAGLFAAVFAVLVGRAVQLTVIEGPALRQKAIRQHTTKVSMLPRRGAIVDRYGEPLALTRESVDVYARPRDFDGGPAAARAIAAALEIPLSSVSEKLASTAPFVWLRRQVALDRWSGLERMDIAGIGAQPSRQRVYPHGELAAQVVGFTGIDGQGLEGVERMLDADLRGEVEDLDVERDAWGRGIVVQDEGRPLPRVGARVELTIDSELQEVVESELARVVHDFEAKAASAVVLAPNTGEILAMATVPGFDPNDVADARPGQWRNRIITDSYEPGSTFKAVLAADALESGAVSPTDRIFCENGSYAVGRRVIHDHRKYGLLEFADVIAQSSNIGAAKVAERLGAQEFGAALQRFGFGEPTGVDLPGEVGGLVRPVDRWRRIHLVTTAFGQGIAVTPLQLARAFAAIANGGILLRPYVVRRVVGENGHVRKVGHPQVVRRVISPQTSAQLTAVLRRVVESGTGTQAQIPGVAVAGKTGTAQKVEPNTGRYDPHARMSSFVGYAPADDPEVVVLVVADSPRKATYGGVVAAPAFRTIVEHALDRRGVLPRAPTRPRPLPTEFPPLQVALPIVPPSSGMVPSFLGLGIREALVLAQEAGWKVQFEGSGYVVAQDPPAGTPVHAPDLVLRFGSSPS